MKRTPPFARRIASLGTACLLALGCVAAHADAGGLRGRYDELKPQLQGNSYGRPMVIESAEGGNTLQGDVYAVLDYPFSKVKTALQDPEAWCDIMLLPFNTKACSASANHLSVGIAKKPQQPVAYRIEFGFSPVTASESYLETRLNAAQGPVGTRDYRINVEAVPLDNGRTFMHMNYAYGYGGAGKFAMQAYMATAGASKVGFTNNGVRGAVERNAMRYYLAIDSYLATMDAPQAQRVDKRINHWFSATERYPRQLHEMDRGTYVSLKRQDYGQQTTASTQ